MEGIWPGIKHGKTGTVSFRIVHTRLRGSNDHRNFIYRRVCWIFSLGMYAQIKDGGVRLRKGCYVNLEFNGLGGGVATSFIERTNSVLDQIGIASNPKPGKSPTRWE